MPPGSWRLHRLTTGAYPTTLDALVPGQLAVVPGDLQGAPFVYNLAGAGFDLAPAGQPRWIVRVPR